MPARDVCGHAVGETHAVRSAVALKGIEVDEETQEAIEDWHYWVAQGYEL